jgi:hypothetical protein
MTESYAKIPTAEAKKYAEDTIATIDTMRAARWAKWIDDYKCRHDRWRFLPWWKPLSDALVKTRILKSGRTADMLCYTAYNRSKAILNLVRAAGSDPNILICSEDLDWIQFGSRRKGTLK